MLASTAVWLALGAGTQRQDVGAVIEGRLAEVSAALQSTLQGNFETRDHSSFLSQLQDCDLALLGITMVSESAAGVWADPCALAGFGFSAADRRAMFADGAVPTAAALRTLGQSGRAMRVASGEHMRFRALSISRDGSSGEVPVTVSWRCSVNATQAAAAAEWAEPWTSAMQVAFPLDPTTVAVWWSPAGCAVASGGDSVDEWWDGAPPALAATVDLYDLLSSMRSWHWCSAKPVAPPQPQEIPAEPPGSWQHEVRWEVLSGGQLNRTVTHRIDGAGTLRAITIEQAEFTVTRRPLEKYSFSRSRAGAPDAPSQPTTSVNEEWHPEVDLTRWPGGARIHIIMRDVLPTVDSGLSTSVDGVAQVVPDRIEIHSGGRLIHEVRFSAFERVAGEVPEWPTVPEPGPHAPWDDLTVVPDSIEHALRLTRLRCETLGLRAIVPIAVASTALSTESASPSDLDEAERLLRWALKCQSVHELTTCTVNLLRIGESDLASAVVAELAMRPDLPLFTLAWVQSARALNWPSAEMHDLEPKDAAARLERFLEGSPIRIENGRTAVPDWFAPTSAVTQPGGTEPPLA